MRTLFLELAGGISTAFGCVLRVQWWRIHPALATVSADTAFTADFPTSAALRPAAAEPTSPSGPAIIAARLPSTAE